MKKFGIFIGILLLGGVAAGCSSSLYGSSGAPVDNLYAAHDRAEIARRRQARAEAERAEAEARRAEWEARIAEAAAAGAEERYYAGANPYEGVVADTYESAYARRLQGFESPTYRLPSSYYNFRYGNAFTYVSAYDPAFYNIVISGDQVWVEPKYITSMFGTWGGTVLYADPWYYGWNPAWGPSFAMGSWGWSVGWNSWYNPYNPWSPWYYGPSWAYGWHGYPYWGGGWHGHGHRPHYDYNRPNLVHRPGNKRGEGYRPPTFGEGGSRGTVNRTEGGNRGWNSGIYQGGGGNNRGNGSVSRGEGNRRNDTGTSWNGDRTNNRRSSSSGGTPSYNGGARGGFSGGGYSGGGRSGGATGSSSRGR